MTKHQQELNKEAEKLETVFASQGFSFPMPELLQALAHYVLEQKAESYEAGYSTGYADADSTQAWDMTDQLQRLGYIEQKEGTEK